MHRVSLIFSLPPAYAHNHEKLCDLKIHQSILSPTRELAAVIFEMNCGATAPFNTQVSVAPADAVFSADEFPSVLSIKGRQQLNVEWLDRDTLKIRVPDHAEVFRNRRTTDGVYIVYQKHSVLD